MTNYQVDLFWEEVTQIQERHSWFFPISQIRYISIYKSEDISKLIFLEGYNLPAKKTQEIQLAFKLISDNQFE